jgi:hypothetical protein
MPAISDHIFVARYVLGLIHTDDIIAFVDRKLSEGQYSDTYLDILDANLQTEPELAQLLETSLQDSGIDIPGLEHATWTMLHYHIWLIANGSVSPKKQFGYLLSDIARIDLTKGINKYVGDKFGIEFMYGWFYNDYESDALIDKGIKEECLKWLKSYASKHS